MNVDLSVVVTCYNYKQYISECILSCINQNTDFNYEIIVIDDGSTDGSQEIIKSFSDEILFFPKENSGVECSSNFGIKKSNGKFITRLDADDFYNENFIQKSLEKIISNDLDDFAFTYSNYSAIDEDSNTLWESDLPVFCSQEIFSRGDFLASGTIFSREALFEAGLYNEEKPNCGLENFELVLKLLKKGRIGLLNKMNLFNYRIHNKNMSHTRRKAIIDYGFKLCRNLNIGPYKTNEFHPYKLEVNNEI